MSRDFRNVSKLWVVAMFELKRNFSIRGELIGLLIVAVVVGIKLGASTMMNIANRADQVQIGIIASGSDVVLPRDTSRLKFIRLSPSDEARARLRLDEQKLGGLLWSNVNGSFMLEVLHSPNWSSDLQAALNHVVLKRRLAVRQMTVADLSRMHKPAIIHIVAMNGQPIQDESAGRAVGLAVIVLSLIASISSFGTIFDIISGEKTDKVSDVVLSCINAQTWIDGKVAAISFIGLKSIVLYGIYALVGAKVFFSGSGLANSSISLSGIAWTLVFSVAGLVLWNCFFAAMASVSVGNEYGSDRRNLILIPMVFYVIAFTGVGNPDNWFMQVLSWFPGSSMIAMPIRILIGNVPWWQVLASFLLLVASVYYMRRIAGAIFRLGMLMFGKPVSLLELLNVIRRERHHTIHSGVGIDASSPSR